MAFEAEASKVALVPDSVAPLEGMRMLVVGFATVMLTPAEGALAVALAANETKV